jgi:hypothetical protein
LRGCKNRIKLIFRENVEISFCEKEKLLKLKHYHCLNPEKEDVIHQKSQNQPPKVEDDKIQE